MPYVEMARLHLRLDYAIFDAFTRELARINGQMLDKQFGEYIDVLVSLPADEAESIRQRFGKS